MAVAIPIAISVLAVLISLVSVKLAHQQVELARAANTLPVLVGLMTEFRSSDFKARQRQAFDAIARWQNEAADIPFEDWSESADPSTQATMVDVRYVSHFYDNIGLLVATEAIGADPLIAFFGSSAITAWENLFPYNASVRLQPGRGHYQALFEHFAAVSRRRDPIALLGRISLERFPVVGT